MTDMSSSSATLKTIELAQHQLVLHNTPTHSPKAGLNPLVDTASHLFSILGKLKNVKSYRHVAQLQKELTLEINAFQNAAEAKGYRSECIAVSRYALCATFDDVIANTPWGSQGQWDSHNLLTVFNLETAPKDRFFLILDRITKEPDIYIDTMEFMYICLSLGYKGNYCTTEFSYHQLEKITHTLYKQICAYRGDFSRTLSPFPAKAAQPVKKTSPKKVFFWIMLLVATIIILFIFSCLNSALDTILKQTYQALMHIGKSIPYEINPL